VFEAVSLPNDAGVFAAITYGCGRQFPPSPAVDVAPKVVYQCPDRTYRMFGTGAVKSAGSHCLTYKRGVLTN